jgi:uncharacterized membrane protein
MSYYPNQGQDPNQPGSQYGGYVPPQPQPGNPYGDQQGQYGYGSYQQGPYNQGQYQYAVPPAGNVSPLGPSSIGMDPKISAGLGYLIGILGIIFFFMEKQNRFVRFHCAQVILLDIAAVVLWVVYFVLIIVAAAAGSGTLFTLFECVFGLGGLALFVGWLVGMIQAFSGKYFKLPIIGNIAEQWAGGRPAGM